MITVYTYCTFQNMQLFLDHGGKWGKKREKGGKHSERFIR